MADVAQDREEVTSTAEMEKHSSELQQWLEQQFLVDDSAPCEPTEAEFERANRKNDQADSLDESFVHVEISKDQIEQTKLITYLSKWNVCKVSSDPKYGAVAWSSPVEKEHLARKKIVINFLGTGTGPIFGRHAHYSSADSDNPISGGHVLCVDAITCGTEMPTIVVRGVGTKVLVDDAQVGIIGNPDYMPDCLGETISGWGVNHRVKLVLEQFALKNIFAIAAEEIAKSGNPVAPMEITLEIFGHSRGGVTCFAFANAFDKFLEACKGKDTVIIKQELKKLVSPEIAGDDALFDAIFAAITNGKIKFNLKIMALDPVEGAACLSEFQSSATHGITPATLRVCGADISYSYTRLSKIVSQVAIVGSVDEHRQSFRISIPGISEETTVVLIPALAGHSAVTGYTTNCAGAKATEVATWLKLGSADKISFYYQLQDALRDLGLIRVARWRSNDELPPCRADFINRNHKHIPHIAEFYNCNSPDAMYSRQLADLTFRHLVYDAIERAICEEYLFTKDPLKMEVIKSWREAARVDTASGLWVDPAAGHRWVCQWHKTEDKYDWRRLDNFSSYPSALYPQPVDIGGAHSSVYDVTLAHNLSLSIDKVFSIYDEKHSQAPSAESVDGLIIATIETNLLLGQINRNATFLAGNVGFKATVADNYGTEFCQLFKQNGQLLFVELQKKLELFNKHDIGNNVTNEILVLIIKRLCFQHKICSLPALASALGHSKFTPEVISAAYQSCLLSQMDRFMELVKGYNIDPTKAKKEDIGWALNWSKQQIDGIMHNLRFCYSEQMLTQGAIDFITQQFKSFLIEFSHKCGDGSKVLAEECLAKLARIEPIGRPYFGGSAATVQTPVPAEVLEQLSHLEQENSELKHQVEAAKVALAAKDRDIGKIADKLKVALATVDTVTGERDAAITACDTAIVARDAALASVGVITTERDTARTERDTALSTVGVITTERDTARTERDALIAEMALLRADLLREQQALAAEVAKNSTTATTQYAAGLARGRQDFKGAVLTNLQNYSQGKAITIVNTLS